MLACMPLSIFNFSLKTKHYKYIYYFNALIEKIYEDPEANTYTNT